MDFDFSKEQLKWEEKSQKFAAKEIIPSIERLEEDLDFGRNYLGKWQKPAFLR